MCKTNSQEKNARMPGKTKYQGESSGSANKKKKLCPKGMRMQFVQCNVFHFEFNNSGCGPSKRNLSG